MVKKILALVISLLFIAGLMGCGETNDMDSITDVKIKWVRREEVGDGVPEILFAENGKIAFWGTFGLYIVNGEDGSVYRSVNLQNIGFNHMSGEIITQFEVGADYNKIYFMNRDTDGENVNEFFWYYNIEENVVRQIPNGTGVEVVEALPNLTHDFAAGGEPESGYSSNVAIYDTDTTVYLLADESWKVRNLKLVFFDLETETKSEVSLFN